MMPVNDPPTLCLKDAVAAKGDVEVTVYCSCGQRLGEYWAGRPRSGEPGITLSEKGLGGFSRVPTRLAARPSNGLLRGPRTQPGLYPEQYGSRSYIRKRCPCLAEHPNQAEHPKRGLGSIGGLPITVSERGVTLVFD